MNTYFDKDLHLETRHLILRFTRPSDTEDLFYAIFHDRKVLKYYMADYVENLEGFSLEKMISRCMEKRILCLSIILRETNKVIGLLNQVGEYKEGEIELGYALSSDYWNRGYMSEALSAVMHYLFEKDVRRINCGFFRENLASERVMQKCGMHFYEAREKEVSYLNEWKDVIYYCKEGETSMENGWNRCWTEVDLSALRRNYQIYQKEQSQNRKIMAVVKADAYGHGDVEVSRVLQEEGCFDFAVSNIEEALRLRKNGIEGQILILGYTPLNHAQELYDNDITQALISADYARELSEFHLPIKAQFAIDTGMRRIGLNADDLDLCEKTIRQYYDVFHLTGMFTHLSVADSENEEDVEFTKEQIGKFTRLADRVADLHMENIHCMNSAGGLWHEAKYSTYSRLGIILYGLKPDVRRQLPEGIEPIMQWKSVISMVKNIKPGDSVGYGRTFIAQKPMRIATVSAGYADGYSRQLSNVGYVLVHGQKARIIGRVCMDQFMIDISEIEDVRLSDEVVLFGKQGDEEITADDIANSIYTIGYEVICGITSRVKRVYINRNE